MRKGEKFTKWLDKFNTEKISNLLKEGKNIRTISTIVKIPEKRLAEMIKHFNNATLFLSRKKNKFDIDNTVLTT